MKNEVPEKRYEESDKVIVPMKAGKQKPVEGRTFTSIKAEGKVRDGACRKANNTHAKA